MKILVISNLYPPDVLGGYEMGCKQAVDALRSAGHEVMVLTGTPRGCGVPHDANVLRRLKFVDVYDPYYQWKSKPVVDLIRHSESSQIQASNVQVLLDTIKEFQPDVAYVWNILAVGGLGLLAAIQHVGVPWVMHLMDDVPRSLCAPRREDSVFKTVAETFTKLARGRFISCSQTTIAEIESSGIDISSRTTIIPNWVTTTGALNRTDYMPNGQLRIISAGSISVAKGVHITIDAAGLMRNMGVDNFVMDIYGPGTDPGFQCKIQQQRLQDFVHLKGPRKQHELYALYPQYDVFCFPTWAREPCAFAPMEAMAFGCVAVLSRANGNAEWFLNNIECLTADRGPNDFAILLAKIARGEIALQEIGQRAARLIDREFRLEKQVSRIESVLRAAIRDGGGPARPASEAFHMALLAEKTIQCLINESAAA